MYDGLNIPVEMRDFRRSSSINRYSRSVPGTGIGLPVCSLAELHEGMRMEDSMENNCFRVTLPANEQTVCDMNR